MANFFSGLAQTVSNAASSIVDWFLALPSFWTNLGIGDLFWWLPADIRAAATSLLSIICTLASLAFIKKFATILRTRVIHNFFHSYGIGEG